jgi:hypothetical protein
MLPPRPARVLPSFHRPGTRSTAAVFSPTRRGDCSSDVDHAGCTWVVILSSPEQQQFYGRTLEEALAWCLVWLMAPEIGIGPFLARPSPYDASHE